MIIDLMIENISLNDALKKASSNDIIYLDNKDYFEKVYVNIPNLTIKGRENSRIIFNANNGSIIPEYLGGNGIKTFGTSGSATLTITEEASNFSLIDIVVENSYISLTGDKMGRQAVAFKCEASGLRVNNCRFIGNQDTFYIDYGSNNIVTNSYIEGDVDFIFGSADCLFINCDIFAKGTFRSYYTAPNTYCYNKIGLVFYKSRFNKESTTTTFLGRWWFPSVFRAKIIPKVSFIDCEFSKDINLDVIQMHKEDLERGDYSIYNSFINGLRIVNINESLYLEIIKNVGGILDKFS